MMPNSAKRRRARRGRWEIGTHHIYGNIGEWFDLVSLRRDGRRWYVRIDFDQTNLEEYMRPMIWGPLDVAALARLPLEDGPFYVPGEEFWQMLADVDDPELDEVRREILPLRVAHALRGG